MADSHMSASGHAAEIGFALIALQRRCTYFADHATTALTADPHACRLVERDDEPKAPKKGKKKKAPKKKSDKGFGR